MLFPSIETGTAMNARESENYLPNSVHQNSVQIYWAEIYRGRLYLRAEIYRGRLLTLITGSSFRLLRIWFSADLTMYWFPVYHFRCMKFKPLVIWIWNQHIVISTIVGTSSHIIILCTLTSIQYLCWTGNMFIIN